MSYPRIREAPESSSAAILQSVAAALSDTWFRPQAATPSQEQIARLASHLPPRIMRGVASRAVARHALDPVLTRYVGSEGLARQALSVYRRIDAATRFPAILVGAPNGAIAYLAGLLQVPFLPAHFLLSFADATHPDDVLMYQEHGAELIYPILQRNPDLLAVNHYDPLHDRFLVEHVNHVRLKLLDLPEAYRHYIREHLEPGGVVLYVDCSLAWEQYQVDERHYFQVGGLGGYVDQDYLNGNDELDAWLASLASPHHGGWRLPSDFAHSSQRESEWGSLPEFRDAVRRFTQIEGYEFRSIAAGHPEDFSAMVYTAYLWESRLHYRTPNGILIECFSQINPTAALRSDLLPIWLPFNCDDSLEYLARIFQFLPKQSPILLSLLATFTQTPDLPGAQAWRQIVAKGAPITWIGVRPDHYPFDLASRFDYLPQLQRWTRSHPGAEPRPHLTPDEFQMMMHYLDQEGLQLFSYLLDNTEGSE